MQDLPIGIQSFQKIREGNYLYVDKTEQVFNIISDGQYYFLSRPRRFGKSLTTTTMQAIFEGKKELFEGLWIENRWNWAETNPVILIPFNELDFKNLGLDVVLNRIIRKEAMRHGIELTGDSTATIFKELIEKLEKAKGKVAVLIDEYDKPIIDYLEKEKLPKAYEHRDILKSFYSVLKSSDQFLRLVFITGVSKFSKVSIFSDLNNLEDISIDENHATLTGYTQAELEFYFREWIDRLCKKFKDLTREQLLEKIRYWYNGYTWDYETRIYNPFSILNFFKKREFGDYWFNTGTPTFLINYLKERDAFDLTAMEVSRSVFENYDLENLDYRSLLFQTGYVTIKSVTPDGLYTLGYPNREVEEAMYSHLLAAYNNRYPADSLRPVLHLSEAFRNNDLPRVISIVNLLFKDIPSLHFAKQSEFLYHALLHLSFRYLGIFIQSEVHTSDGRIDAVVTTQTHVFLLEFKLDESADAALGQILEKNYAEKYRHSGREIVGVGINFSSEKKAVEGWKSETLK